MNDRISRKRVLVTGGFGGIGREILANLLSVGHDVTCLDLKSRKTQKLAQAFKGRVKTIWGSVCDESLLSVALKEIDVVIHMAAVIAPLANNNPALATAVNVDATKALVKLMEESPDAKRLIFASSVAVAGKTQHTRIPPLRADETPSPCDHYGRTKAECEAHIFNSELHWSILRIGVCPHVNLIGGSKEEMRMVFDTSANGRVEFVHWQDVGIAFANTVDCDDSIKRILLIGGGQKCQTYAGDLFDMMFGSMGIGKLPPGVFHPGPPRFLGDWLDTEESNSLLHYQRHSIEDFSTWLRRRYIYLHPFIKAISPIALKFIIKQSPHYRPH